MPRVAAAQTARADSIARERQRAVERQRAGPDSAQQVERVLVNAIRGAGVAPVSGTTIDRAAITERHYGQDVPMLLQGAVPSLSAHTETGTPWGYSYLRLRGLDQTRINITIDGVPLNDMEDQVLYFANFADLMSNVQSVQVQRGVGTSTAGTASFAGSVNFETAPIARANASGDASVQLGSFGSQRVTVGGSTGLMQSGFAAYARGSALRTNGFRDHSGVLGRSALVGAGWFGARNIVKITALAGLLADTLSYTGATLAELAENRRFNPLAPGEKDKFGQQMVALAYTHLLDGGSTFNTTLYRNSASGNYDYFDGDDRYRYGLAHSWYGVTSAVNTEGARWRTNIGINANTYQRAHRLYLRPDLDTPLYDNTGHKQDASAFAKLSYDAGPLTWFGDLQVRHAEFRYQPDVNAGIAERSISWSLFNPKAGVTWHVAHGLSAYASYGATTREPARSDLFAGDDDLNASNVSDYGDFTRVEPERVGDAELGVRYVRGIVSVQANVYDMQFHNDIARIGAPTASGSILRRNVGRSYRRGIELDGTIHAARGVTLGGTLALSDNRIRQFTDSSRDTPVVRINVEPLLTPRIQTAQRIIVPVGAFEVSAEGRYQGRAYLDNTGSSDRILPDYYSADVGARYTRGRYSLMVRGINIGDTRKYGSGSVSGSGTVRYFVLPARSLQATFTTTF